MLNTVNPRQTVLVTCRAKYNNFGKDEIKDNIIALDWHIPLSFKPLMYGISAGKTRFSCELISRSKCFAVNFMSIDFQKEVLFCGRHTGRHMDKFTEAGLTKKDCDKIDCARIKEALAYIECEVVDEIDTGDHVLFIGKVAASALLNQGKRIFHIVGDDFTTTVD
ncbi:flavin reductase family protein [Candidatus Woesearchaeota archaeon]|nr:flavin reductase family protein [Candidatus Woesearchaeota archaeon]